MTTEKDPFVTRGALRRVDIERELRKDALHQRLLVVAVVFLGVSFYGWTCMHRLFKEYPNDRE